jgi:hypothetical protein
MEKFILDMLLIFKIDLKKLKIKKKVRWEYSMNHFFWAQSKHKTQTAMQFFGFLFFLTYQNAF